MSDSGVSDDFSDAYDFDMDESGMCELVCV